MAATKYLDYDGLLYFWSLIKAKLALKADAQSVTAGSYGPSADASPAHNGTFKVPYVQVTSQGVVTAISEKTITLPASGNTDTKVKQNLKATSDTGKYPILLKKGDCIGQGIIKSYLLADDDETEGKRTGGFGSTNK